METKEKINVMGAVAKLNVGDDPLLLPRWNDGVGYKYSTIRTTVYKVSQDYRRKFKTQLLENDIKIIRTK